MAHINFSKFKLTYKDKDRAVLKHKDGHIMTLAIKGLHPGNRAELDKLPIHESKGGQVNLKLKEAHKEPIKEPKPVDDMHRLPPAPNSERAGPYGKELLADGGEIDKTKKENKLDIESVGPQDIKTKGGLEVESLCSGGMAHYDEGGDITPEELKEINPAAYDKMAATAPISINTANPSMGDWKTNPNAGSGAGMIGPTVNPSETAEPSSGQSAQQSVSQSPQSGQIPQSTPNQPQSPVASLEQPEDMAKQVNEATGMQLQGMGAEATAQGELGKHQAIIANQQAKAQQDIASHIQSVTATHNAEIQSVVQDIKDQHIDPNHYLSSLGTSQKIGTGIGLILGGIGAGLTHGPNMALDFLNKQIDRDIDAQKMELGKKENLVSMYTKMLGNERDGAIMASQVMAHVTADKMLAAGAASQNSLAQARAQQAAGALIASRAPELQRLNMTQGLINASKSGLGTDNQAQQVIGYMRAVNPEQAKEMESRYVPGLGMAQVPITPADRSALATKATGLNMARDLRNWAQQHSGDLNPATINEGKAKATAMLNYYRTSTDQGVIKPSELEFDSKIVDSDPTKFFNKFRVDPKYKTLEDSMTKDLNSIRQQYGLPLEKNTAVQGQIKTNAKGEKYQQQPDGSYKRI